MSDLTKAEREIVFDTETTGLSPGEGHRVVEIGCVELINHVPTGKNWQRYVNPDRYMPGDAFRVHGLSEEFLAKQPRFAEVVDDFLAFVGTSPVVAHNASFDVGFINAELALLKRPPLNVERVIDTVSIARRKYPGAQASLDALCRRFSIDLSARTKHGALLDAELLAEVYLELIGGRQPTLGLAVDLDTVPLDSVPTRTWPERTFKPSLDDLVAHAAFLQKIKDPIWLASKSS
ncbi:MAG: DNA polymerase III subunit epsilon [Proteobacteria bacterium]|nr:DNA polymerase III subunit epsilon [Pseudomonadota bacterium]MDA1057820.1 DNA polymerase III subunit epsilon [Pseudomonadota bacterium]